MMKRRDLKLRPTASALPLISALSAICFVVVSGDLPLIAFGRLH
jgi:hypothetical protein